MTDMTCRPSQRYRMNIAPNTEKVLRTDKSTVAEISERPSVRGEVNRRQEEAE